MGNDKQIIILALNFLQANLDSESTCERMSELTNSPVEKHWEDAIDSIRQKIIGGRLLELK